MSGQMIFDYQQEIERLRDDFDFDFVGLALVQSVELRFEMKWEFATGNRSNRYRRIVLKTGKGVVGRVFKTGKPFLVEDAEKTLGRKDLYNYPIVVAEGLKSFCAIPLYKYNCVKGVLLVGYRTENKLTQEDFIGFQQVIGPKFGPFYNKEMVGN
ncbi:GAF domain-containing protein [Sporosarcina sp. ANT_H38]|uniref:GAF domain-containing protein n=1 Tax=Sporosarcina sp. ANT_H38 TaxID=2597358 RepID=UPI0011F345BE|nr:GAF domain-containing protein [Sporosarcina sp. ANT_H38]KAA0955785.1 GAF domain-containing protein [Sporosarcina sp. ANT_H38]